MQKVLVILLISAISLFANIAKVTAIQGDVSIERDKQLITAKIGSKLLKADRIITGNNSRIQIVFTDNTIISLGKNSTIAVEEYVFNVGEKPKATFKFGNGVFKSISGKISKLNPTKYKLKTKSASMGIRGTIVGLDLSDVEEIYMVLDGKIEVTNGNKRTILSKGRQLSFKNGVVDRVRIISKRTSDKLEKESGAKDNENESGINEGSQTTYVTSAEKCNYR